MDFYHEWHMFIDVSQEMMPDDAEEFAVGSETTVKHRGELKGSSSLKRKTSMPLLSTEKEGEGESGASATSSEHGKGVCPRSCIVVLASRVWLLPPPPLWSCSHQGPQLWLTFPVIPRPRWTQLFTPFFMGTFWDSYWFPSPY